MHPLGNGLLPPGVFSFPTISQGVGDGNQMWGEGSGPLTWGGTAILWSEGSGPLTWGGTAILWSEVARKILAHAGDLTVSDGKGSLVLKM